MRSREKNADPDDQIKSEIVKLPNLVVNLNDLNFSESFASKQPHQAVVLLSQSKAAAGLGKCFRFLFFLDFRKIRN